MAGTVDRLSKKIEAVARFVYAVIRFPKRLIRINSVISKPSYYSEMERKTRAEMWLDNFKWLIKKGELNEFYISFGMDIKGFRDPKQYIARPEFMLWRNSGNQKMIQASTGSYNSIVLLRDKYVFAEYLASAIGKEYIVPSYALISKGRVFFSNEKRWGEISELLVDGSELVYKVIDGECADGVMLVTVSGDKVIADDREYDKAGFIESLPNRTIVVQNVVKQHAELQKFGTRSVNTIRVVTIMGKSGEVNLFAAFLRLGASAESFVENRAVGGLGVGLNLETGELMKYGFPHDSFGVRLEKHPLSGLTFEGFQIPYWKEAVELVKNAHRQFYGIQSIGWDVVITENGPILLEGNDNWEIGGPQDTYGGLREKWFELVNT